MSEVKNIIIKIRGIWDTVSKIISYDKNLYDLTDELIISCRDLSITFDTTIIKLQGTNKILTESITKSNNIYGNTLSEKLLQIEDIIFELLNLSSLLVEAGYIIQIETYNDDIYDFEELNVISRGVIDSSPPMALGDMFANWKTISKISFSHYRII